MNLLLVFVLSAFYRAMCYIRIPTPAPLKLRPYGAIQMCILLLLLLLTSSHDIRHDGLPIFVLRNFVGYVTRFESFYVIWIKRRQPRSTDHRKYPKNTS